jgi:hypothetical protein
MFECNTRGVFTIEAFLAILSPYFALALYAFVQYHTFLINGDNPGCVGGEAVWNHIIKAQSFQAVAVCSFFKIG